MAVYDTTLDPGENDLAAVPLREDVERLVSHLGDELRVLSANRNAISKRISAIKQTVGGLNALLGSRVVETRRAGRHRGLTKLCRELLDSSGSDPLTLSEILQYIQEKCPERLSNNKHPNSSLRTILKRLVNYGEAVAVMNEKGLLGWVASKNARRPRDQMAAASSVSSCSRAMI